MPITRSRGKPVVSFATYDMTSSGFETMIRIASGDVRFTFSATSFTIPALVFSRSSRLIPGFRAIPAVMTTMLEPADSSYPFEPMTRASKPSIGPDSCMSRPFPCGIPSAMSTMTTSRARWRRAMPCAAVAPTWPAPTTVILPTMSPAFRRGGSPATAT